MKSLTLRGILGVAGAVALVACSGAVTAGGQSPDSSTAGHRVLTSEQDRQRLMDMLKITMFPWGPGAYRAST